MMPPAGRESKTRPNFNPAIHSYWLEGVAVFGFLLGVARACIQSITIDEADGWYFYAARPTPSHWDASSVNHLMNSLVMRLFITVFGLSPVTIRMPALIGAVIYIVSCYYFVRLISDRLHLQVAILLCLVYNPFVLDHLVAGRGYSLAVALLVAAVVRALYRLRPDAVLRPVDYYSTAVLCSLCAAVSFCASFSFAVVDAVTMLFIIGALCRRAASDIPARRLEVCGRIIAAGLLPGLALTAFLAGDILSNWRQISLAWGAASFKEMWKSVIGSSTYEPSKYLLSPTIYRFVMRHDRFVFTVVGVALAAHIAALAVSWRAIRDRRTKWLATVALGCTGVLAVTLLIHRAMYGVAGILMPMGRRAVFIAALAVMVIGALAAMPAPSRAAEWTRRFLTVSVWAMAVLFLFCLRLTYFMEWKYNADSQRMYEILAWYNHRYCVTEYSPNWRYVSAINFYRVKSGRETLPEVSEQPPEEGVYPVGKEFYLLFFENDASFIEREKLKVVYRDEDTGSVIAIRPDVESRRCE